MLHSTGYELECLFPHSSTNWVQCQASEYLSSILVKPVSPSVIVVDISGCEEKLDSFS